MVQQKPTAASLRHAHCLFHPLREAAALCPHCGGTYCRECVTDEEGKLACPPCLRKLSRPPAPKLSAMNRVGQILMGFAALVSLTVLVFMLLRWRTDRPEQHVSFDGVGANQPSEQSDE
jgi:hypothetical protein